MTQLPMANKWKEAPPEECLWVSSEAIITSTFRFVIVHRVWRNGNLFPSSPSSYSLLSTEWTVQLPVAYRFPPAEEEWEEDVQWVSPPPPHGRPACR